MVNKDSLSSHCFSIKTPLSSLYDELRPLSFYWVLNVGQYGGYLMSCQAQ